MRGASSAYWVRSLNGNGLYEDVGTDLKYQIVLLFVVIINDINIIFVARRDSGSHTCLNYFRRGLGLDKGNVLVLSGRKLAPHVLK